MIVDPTQTQPSKAGFCGSGLTESDYKHLHYIMGKEHLKPTLCDMCGQAPPQHLACVKKYESDPDDFRWMCRSCHWKFDYKNGARVIPSFFGKKHTEIAKQKVGLANSGENNGFLGKKHTEVSKQMSKM